MSSHIVTEDEVREQEKLIHNHTNDQVTFLNKLLDSIKALQGNIADLQNQLKAEQDKVAGLEGEKAQLQSNIAQLEETKRQNESTIEEMKKKIAELTEELERDKGEIYRQIDERDKKIVNLTEEIDVQKVEIKSLHHLKSQVESFLIGHNQLKEPSHACVLPDDSVAVTDVELGLLLFSGNAELLQEVKAENWKWPQGLAYHEEAAHIYVSLIRKPGADSGPPKTPTSPGGWVRAIGIFNLKLEPIKFIDGPQNTGFENVAKENLAICKKTGDLLFSIADNLGSAIYRINLQQLESLEPGASADKLWNEIATRSGVVFTDFQVMPTPGPMTDLLIVEAKKAYIYRWSVQEKQICGQFNYAPVPKPSSLAIDEKGMIFVHDSTYGKIYLLNSMSFETERDVCLVEGLVSSITAHHGCLAVSQRAAKQVVIYRYFDGVTSP